MMADLIERNKALLETWKEPTYTDPLNVLTEVRDRIEALPAVDAVPVGAYKQVRWERDIAIGQLRELGYELGEKVTPVKHGRWKAVTDDGDEYKRICSCCGEYAPFDEFDDAYLLYPHCPWCGARMDGKDGNDDPH